MRKHIPHSLGAEEDVTQDVWCYFIQGDYLNRYNPEMAAPTTYLWEFTRLRCLHYLASLPRTPTANALSIRTTNDGETGIVDPDISGELSYDTDAVLELRDLLYRAEVAVRDEPICGQRDLRKVWRLLVKRGYSRDQAAREMSVSAGTICTCVSLLRKIPAVIELKLWATDNGVLWTSRIA